MLPELGHFALILALIFAAMQAVVPLLGAATGRVQWMHMSRPLSWGQFTFLLISFVMLAISFKIPIVCCRCNIKSAQCGELTKAHYYFGYSC